MPVEFPQRVFDVLLQRDAGEGGDGQFLEAVEVSWLITTDGELSRHSEAFG
jgi:hypothetical protein